MKTMFHKISATLGLAAITGLGVALPASAATFAEWGEWVDGAEDRLVFSDPGLSDATFSVSNANTWRVENPATGTDVESFSANSPVGALIGANTGATNDFALYVFSKDENREYAIVTITFDTEVPAGNLALALSNVNDDHALIEMIDGSSVSLTGTEIIGTATNTGFSSTDIASDPIPTVVANANSVSIDAPETRNDASTGWVRPSAAVKTIAIAIASNDSYYGMQRVWIGQIGGSEDVGGSSGEGLAKTGATDSMYLVAFAGAAILATAGIVRRRTN
jgi:LPXTG-motif cell wall-anchored protein